jgi:hypothetical protein
MIDDELLVSDEKPDLSPDMFQAGRLEFKDNTCTLGWCAVWSNAWTYKTARNALLICPEGDFTQTFYSAEFFSHDAGPLEWTAYGHSAYFNFPLDDDGAYLLTKLKLTGDMLNSIAMGRTTPMAAAKSMLPGELDD